MYISVIMPTFNKAKRLELVLYTLSKQSLSMDMFEVIVIDDGSSDCTCDVVSKYISASELNIKYVYQRNKGRAAARNKGIEAATGEVIIFLDDDRLVNADFLKHYSICFEKNNNPNLVALGERKNLYISKYEERFEAIKTDFFINPEILLKRAREEYFWSKVKKVFEIPQISWISFATGNVCLYKKFLCDVGKFNESFTGWGLEDTELGYRLWKSKAKFIHKPEAVNFHIEHTRNPIERKEDETRNHNLFYELHPELPVLCFRQFVYREISLEEFTRRVCGEAQESEKSAEIFHMPKKSPSQISL